MTTEIQVRGSVVDRGGIRGRDGKIDNLRHVGQRPGGATITPFPHTPHEPNIESTLNNRETLRKSPGSSNKID